MRFWKPWGILMCIGAIVPNMFPGWATSGVTIFGYLTGYGEGAVPYISIIALIALGITLTTSPVVYNTMEKAEFFKVGLTFLFLIIAIFSAISADGSRAFVLTAERLTGADTDESADIYERSGETTTRRSSSVFSPKTRPASDERYRRESINRVNRSKSTSVTTAWCAGT